MPEVRAIWRYWKQHPPIDWLAAGYLKYKPPTEPSAGASSRSGGSGDFNELARMFGATPGLKLVQGGKQ